MGSECWIGNQHYSLFQDTETICKWDYKAANFETIRRERTIQSWKEDDHKQQTNNLDINPSSESRSSYEKQQIADQIIHLSPQQQCKSHELSPCLPQISNSIHPRPLAKKQAFLSYYYPQSTPLFFLLILQLKSNPPTCFIASRNAFLSLISNLRYLKKSQFLFPGCVYVCVCVCVCVCIHKVEGFERDMNMSPSAHPNLTPPYSAWYLDLGIPVALSAWGNLYSVSLWSRRND